MKKNIIETKTVKLIELVFDILVIIGSFVIALSMLHLQTPNLFFSGQQATQMYWSLGFIAGTSLLFFRIYSISMFKGNYLRNILKVVFSLFFVASLTFVFQLLYPNYLLSVYSPFLMVPIAIGILAITNYAFYLFLQKYNVKLALICGPRREVDKISKKILMDNNSFTMLNYIIYDDFDINDYSRLYGYVDKIDHVYITEQLSPSMKNSLISYCLKMQKPYFIVPKLHELTLNKSTMTQISDTMVFGVKGLGLTVEQRFFKRFFDLVVSLIVFIILSPLMLVVAILVKAHDRGPVFFKQKRMTRNNRIFTLYKFRSMIPDAEKHTGAIQAEKNDKRITPIGKILRKTRLDELPQLLNVISGDMSLVGPRALRVEEIEEFTRKNPEFQYRLNVKAGVT